MIKTMRAIEYNAWMSLIKFISENLPIISSQYGLSNINVDVTSSYPKDMTKFTKPSIIVQKIHTKKSKLGFGNVVGQYLNEDDNILQDIKGAVHETTYQINVEGTSNTNCSLLTSLVTEGIFGMVSDVDNKSVIGLYDFIDDINNPILVGRLDLDGDIDITPLESNPNNDYTCAIRVDLVTVQNIVPDVEYVDLEKPFKFTYHINL